MFTRADELEVGFQRYEETDIIGLRTRYVSTFNPTTAKAGEEIKITIPRLKSGCCLVPRTMFLLFDMKVSDDKSTIRNNIGKNLVKDLTITYANEQLYKNTKESVFECYNDLWLSDGVRGEKIEDGILSERYRQKMSGNSAYVTNDKTEGLYRIYGNKQRIALGSVINDHGLYAPYDMVQEFQYVITLAENADVLSANRKKNKAGEFTDEYETLGEYTLENLQLEYETIENKELFDEVNQQFQTGRSLVYEHKTHYISNKGE